MYYVVAILALAGVASRGEVPMKRLGRDALCVTEGKIEALPDQRLSVDVPKMRAFVDRETAQGVAAEFVYLGPSAHQEKLGSGKSRRQFGLKLRAHDACNVVYAIWRMEPEAKLVVSVKSNAGEHSSAECGNRGYRNIAPVRASAVPVLRPGDKHRLRGEMNGEHLRVFVDEGIVWEGSVGAIGFDGPVGMRSDNVRLEIALEAQVTGDGREKMLACKPEAE